MRIDTITKEQIARFPEWTKRWIEIGLSTEPADFDVATAAALRGYELANLNKPLIVLRMSSPYGATYGGILAWMLLRSIPEVWSQVESQVESQVGSQVRSQVESQVRSQVRSQVGSQVRSQVGSQVESQVESQVWSQVESQVESQVWSQVWSQVESQVWSQVRSQVGSAVYNDFGGQLWGSGFAAYVSFFRDVMGWRDEVLDKFESYEALTKSCGWVWWHENILAISDRPSAIHRDDAGRLHCEDGPSIAYRDGWALHHWHGVVVPADVIESPSSITIDRIRSEENSEVRRVMIERYGYERYCKDAGLTLVDSRTADDPLIGLRTAKLWRDEANDIVLLDMLNSTPEPDGSVKRYVLSVDGEAYNGRAARDCLAAMASTWRRASDYSLFFAKPEDYQPIAES